MQLLLMPIFDYIEEELLMHGLGEQYVHQWGLHILHSFCIHLMHLYFVYLKKIVTS